VDDQDRAWLFSYVRDITKSHLGEDFDRLFINLDSNGDGQVTEDDLRSLMFCDFSDAKSDAKNYIEIKDLEQLRHVVENYLDEYNNLSKKPMNLVMFRFWYFQQFDWFTWLFTYTCANIYILSVRTKNWGLFFNSVGPDELSSF